MTNTVLFQGQHELSICLGLITTPGLLEGPNRIQNMHSLPRPRRLPLPLSRPQLLDQLFEWLVQSQGVKINLSLMVRIPRGILTSMLAIRRNSIIYHSICPRGTLRMGPLPSYYSSSWAALTKVEGTVSER